MVLIREAGRLEELQFIMESTTKLLQKRNKFLSEIQKERSEKEYML